MIKRVVNLEINEVSPSLLKDYINKNKNSNLAKLQNCKKLNIYTTKALDIKKDKLYPSQTWASFNTGKPYSEHKCYWYSDNINIENLLWNKLASKNVSVGIIGSIHSSKCSPNLYSDNNFKFYLPDCFSNEDFAKPKSFTLFQSLNNKLVRDSARVTGLFSLLKTFIKYSFQIIFFPRKFGISLLSLKMIISIIFFSVFYKNKELLRMAQFPLIASIFCDLFRIYRPEYSTVFTNHVAGNMHRYWYAYDQKSFKYQDKYSKDWINKNKRSIFLGIDYVDQFLGFILNKKEFKDTIILLTSSMGQEASPTFDKRFLAKYDGKIENINLFSKHLSNYLKQVYGKNIELICCRNMAPTYGFKVKNQSNLDLNLISKSIKDFVTNLGITCSVDEEDGSLVLTILIYTDINFQKRYQMDEANKRFLNYGFTFFPINDHHSGSHCEYGSLLVINSSKKFDNSIYKFKDREGYINYLNFYKLITEYFEI